MADVEFSFEDNSVKINKTMCNKVEALLLEVSAELVSQTARNTRVDTGELKGSWAANLSDTGDVYTATIGSPLKNAIWEEFGTGEYAANGNGRLGGWVYVDEEGNGHFTHGKTPSRAFQTAYNSKKNTIIRHMQSEFKKGLT